MGLTPLTSFSHHKMGAKSSKSTKIVSFLVTGRISSGFLSKRENEIIPKPCHRQSDVGKSGCSSLRTSIALPPGQMLTIPERKVSHMEPLTQQESLSLYQKLAKQDSLGDELLIAECYRNVMCRQG